MSCQVKVLPALPRVSCRWRPTHAREAEDEEHEPLPADAERGASEREGPEEPGGGRAAGGRAPGNPAAREETLGGQGQTWSPEPTL